MDPFSQDVLNFRPDIVYVAPLSGETISEATSTEPVVTRQKKVEQLKQGFKNVVVLADAAEAAIDKKVGKFVAKLNIAASPEDMATAQAIARCNPELAREISPGILVVEEITFDMFKKCLKELEDYGKNQAKKSLLPKATNLSPTRTNFGGNGGADNRPEVNNMSAPIAPIDMAAFIAAGIPVLFGMLFPLISGYVKTQIIGHTHPVVVPPAIVPIPSLPGIPVLP